ncbi:MAG: ATP-binding cassette domain-containing protein [Bacillota bacterium]|nr:ATP-binding cassette domain-containing protein [Bacillota bacterium]
MSAETARRPGARPPAAPSAGPLPWLAGLLALYLLLPVGVYVVYAGQAAATGRLGPPDPAGLYGALKTSLLSASLATLAVAAGGIPLGYFLARRRGRSGRWLGLLEALVQVPLALPPLVSGILLLLVIGPYTWLGRWSGGRLTDSLAGVTLAEAFVSAPFLVISARSAFAAVNPSLEEVAATLGMRPLARFLRIALPAAWPGVRAGILLAWLRAFGDFGATVMVAYHPASLPVYTFVQFGSAGLGAALVPVAPAIVVAVLLLLLAGRLSPGLGHRGRAGLLRVDGAGPAPAAPPAPPDPPARPRAALSAASAGARTLSFRLEAELDGFSLRLAHVARAPRLALLGPSGSGKSLTLRLLAGVEGRGGGELRLGEAELGALPPEERGVGYVPQDYALFPHLTVREHLLLAARDDVTEATFWLERLGLGGLAERLPGQLSGGQRQRVALGRALAARPRLLLLDEPLSALDAPLRRELRLHLRQLQRETGLATVLATHDPEEAAFLADELLVIRGGRLLQAGPAEELLRRPATPEVARLLGLVNTFPGRLERGRLESGGLLLPWTGPPAPAAGPASLSDPAPDRMEGEVMWSVAPGAVRLLMEGEEARPGEVAVEGILRERWTAGEQEEAWVELPGPLTLVVRRSAGGEAPLPGARCRIAIPLRAVRLWPRAGSDPRPARERAASGARGS